ncbi:hypothetical protein ZWY2020_043624 [Hordeum vulgare]|nr:hypothetical protein ZWY2020_043624 [Hordeum vulgare]
MAASTLKAQLNALLASMFAMVSPSPSPPHLAVVWNCRGGGSASGFVAEVVTLFIDDADRIITALLDQPAVDFDKVDTHVHQLNGRSSSWSSRSRHVVPSRVAAKPEEEGAKIHVTTDMMVEGSVYVSLKLVGSVTGVEGRWRACGCCGTGPTDSRDETPGPS